MSAVFPTFPSPSTPRNTIKHVRKSSVAKILVISMAAMLVLSACTSQEAAGAHTSSSAKQGVCTSEYTQVTLAFATFVDEARALANADLDGQSIQMAEINRSLVGYIIGIANALEPAPLDIIGNKVELIRSMFKPMIDVELNWNIFDNSLPPEQGWTKDGHVFFNHFILALDEKGHTYMGLVKDGTEPNGTLHENVWKEGVGNVSELYEVEFENIKRTTWTRNWNTSIAADVTNRMETFKSDIRESRARRAQANTTP